MTLQERLWKKPWKDLTTGQKWGRVGLWFVTVVLPLSVVGGSIAAAYFVGHAKGYNEGIDAMNNLPPVADPDKNNEGYLAYLPTQEPFVVTNEENAMEFGKIWGDAVSKKQATEEDYRSAINNSAIPSDLLEYVDTSFKNSLKQEDSKTEEKQDEKNEQTQESEESVPDLATAQTSNEYVVTSSGVEFKYKDGVLCSVTMQDDLGRTVTAEVVNGKVSVEGVANGVSSVMGTTISPNEEGVSKLTSAINSELEKVGQISQSQGNKNQDSRSNSHEANQGPSL